MSEDARSSMPAALPSVSVVIPCYNAVRYVGGALRSVFAQGWPEIEVIVVDDGSTDGSFERIATEFPDVRLLRQANAGVAAARNRGVAEARGEWIAFLDADDFWLPGKLMAQWRALEADDRVRMAYTAWETWFSKDEDPSADYLAELSKRAEDPALWDGPSGWIYPALLVDCVVWTSTVMAHRSLLDEAGPMDGSLRVGEDWDLWLRTSQISRVIRVPQPLALYRIHGASLTRTPHAENYRNVLIHRALRRWGYRSPDGACARHADVRRSLAQSWIDFSGAHLDGGNPGCARVGALNTLRYEPWRVVGWKLLAKALLQGLRASAVRRP